MADGTCFHYCSYKSVNVFVIGHKSLNQTESAISILFNFLCISENPTSGYFDTTEAVVTCLCRV